MCLALVNKLIKSWIYRRKCNPKRKISTLPLLCSSNSKHFWLFPDPGIIHAKMLFIGPCFAVVIFVVSNLLLKYLPVASVDFFKQINRFWHY